LKERFLIPVSSKESLGNEALASYITGAAKETVKALGFSPPLWKRGGGGGQKENTFTASKASLPAAFS